MSSEISVHSLITYVITRLADMEATFGKTKLVKLLYLIDVEFYRTCTRTLTDFEWVFYHYGPYTHTIDSILKQLELDIPQEDVVTTSGYKAKIFKTPKYLAMEFTEFEKAASSLQKSIVDGVVNEWGLEDLNPILSHVYFHTEPMRDAHRGESLDFSNIHRSVLLSSSKKTQLTEEQHKDMLKRFVEAKKSHLTSTYQSLDPKPRLDDVFERILQNLENEDRSFIIKGDLEIGEQFKDQMRRQTK